MNNITTVALLSNPLKDKGFSYYEMILDYLKKNGFKVLSSSEMKDLTNVYADGYFKYEQLFEYADCGILIGGDGTILNASYHAVRNQCPMLGINFGKTGYIAELEPDEYTELTRLASGDYYIQNRITLDVKVEEKGTVSDFYQNALNDAVIAHVNGMHTIELELDCDGTKVMDYRANGLIISTPTGSTGYSLSAGGTVIQPDMDCIEVTPICSLYPACKPVVFSSKSTMKVINRHEREEYVLLNADGRKTKKLMYGSSVICSVSPIKAKMIKLKNNNFYSVLQSKII